MPSAERIPPYCWDTAQLFEDGHQRLDLLNKISNARMAIALSEVHAQDTNLPHYIQDGLDLSRDVLVVLGHLEANPTDISSLLANFPNSQYLNYVVVDILTDKGKKELTIRELREIKEYASQASVASSVFETIQNQLSLEEEKAQKASKFLKWLEDRIKETYSEEEALFLDRCCKSF